MDGGGAHQRDALARDGGRAPVLNERSDEGAETCVGGREPSAPSPSPGLMERHRAAMSIVASLGFDERWALLEAVVWPSDEMLAYEAGRDAA